MGGAALPMCRGKVSRPLVCSCEEPSVGVWLGVGAAFLHSALYTLERNQSYMIRTTNVTFSTLPSISIALMTSFAVHGSRTGLCDGKVGRGWAVDCLHLCDLGPGLGSLGILLDSSILLFKKKKKSLKLKRPLLTTDVKFRSELVIF